MNTTHPTPVRPQDGPAATFLRGREAAGLFLIQSNAVWWLNLKPARYDTTRFDSNLYVIKRIRMSSASEELKEITALWKDAHKLDTSKTLDDSLRVSDLIASFFVQVTFIISYLIF